MTRVFDAAFYGSALSENITETPEGYLICHDVPLGRIGKQIYLGREIAENLDPNKQYTVYRFAEDVFEPEAIASGEAKPLTEDHPHDPVTPDNHHIYAKGHVQNVRPDDHREYLLGDVVIKDRDLINKVKNKQKREVSIGYDTEYVPHGEGFKQTSIRINHIALVAKGRAGPRVKINDSEPVTTKKRRPKFMSMNRKKALATVLAAFAKDADPEELKEVLMALDEDTEEEDKKKKEAEDKSIVDRVLDALKGKDKKSKDADKDEDGDEDEPEKEEAKDKKGAKDKKAKDKKSKDDGDDDELEAALDSGDEEETKDSEEEGEKEDKDEEEAKDRKKAHDHYIEFVKDLKPTLAALPPQYRNLVKDALRENAPSNGNYKRITESVRANAKAKKTKDGEITPRQSVEEICAGYDRFNPLTH